MSKQALAGLKVLECCSMVAGPYCSKLLADLGADVIKVEEPDGDEARRRGPFLHDIPHPERSGLFLYLNTNKIGLTLDLAQNAGKQIFEQLVRDVDIVVEDKPPGKMQDLGLDYESLKCINPNLIMASITPFGQTGPYKDHKAYYINTFASGGECYLLPGGDEWRRNHDREPIKTGNYAGEVQCSIMAVAGILLAVYYRNASGCGQYVDISKQEALLNLNRVELARYPNQGFLENRMTRMLPVGGLFECSDGYAQIMPLEDHMWYKLVEFMGNPEWASDELFKDRASRTEHGERANALLEVWTKDQKVEDLYHGAQAEGCAVAPICSPEDILKSEQLKVRNFFAELDHPEAGRLSYPFTPYKLSHTPRQAKRPAPLLGEHNQEVYGQRLGFSKDDLIRLREAGVI
ncbi:MAG: CoA transferase [Chloroflexota bacterium]|nr:CoA transferase [Chloroflexota bacterium]